MGYNCVVGANEGFGHLPGGGTRIGCGGVETVGGVGEGQAGVDKGRQLVLVVNKEDLE